MKPLKKEIKTLNMGMQELYKRIKKTKDKEQKGKLTRELLIVTSEFNTRVKEIRGLLQYAKPL